MSAVTAQPLPFGRLERERHIEALFSAFRGQQGQSRDPRGSPVSRFPGEGASTWLQEPEGQRRGASWRRGEEEGCTSGPSGGETGAETGNLEEGDQHSGTVWPQGLALLDAVSQLHITAKPELQGPHCVPRRTYSIATATRDQLYVAVEESTCLCLQCCGPARSCTLQGFDRQARRVFLFDRPLRVDACCLGCCLMEMRAFTPDCQLVGAVRQRWSVFTPLLEVCDSDGEVVARIQGSCCPCRCYANQEFQIVSTIGEKLGRIWKKWPGFNEECNMDHEYFGLDVPQEMCQRSKVLLLAATFLLNHMFFEMS